MHTDLQTAESRLYTEYKRAMKLALLTRTERIELAGEIADAMAVITRAKERIRMVRINATLASLDQPAK